MTVPITIDATATRAVATALVRQLLAWIGAALVTKGFVPQQFVDTFLGQTADQLVGGTMVTGAALWAAWKAQHTNAKLVALGTRLSDGVAVVK